MNITAKTNLAMVIGKPIRHSLSPELHNFISDKLGIDCLYVAFEMDKEAVKNSVLGIKALGIRGSNVTAPYKYDVMNYVDKLDKSAIEAGSVNTIYNDGGTLVGYSTDGEGLYRSMKRAKIEIEGHNVLVIGAGGVARPVCVMLVNRGAKRISVINRTKSRIDELSDFVKEKTGFKISGYEGKYDIIINCTSLGMTPNEDDYPDIDYNLFDENTSAVDLIYSPQKTVFLKKAEEKGAKILNGKGMLIYQGIAAYEIFNSVKVPEDVCIETERKFGVCI